MLTLGYVTNGFGDHTLEQAAEVLRHCGYGAIGVTLGGPHLDPWKVSAARLKELRALFEKDRLQLAIETGARYVLDPYRKHRPSLVSVDPKGRAQRVAYYERAIDIAAELGASVVSLWSGIPQPRIPAEKSFERLVGGLRPVLDRAGSRGVKIAFEPEPGMFIESLADWVRLRDAVDHPALGLTIDVGHLAVTEEPPWEECLRTHAKDLIHVHLDDAKDRTHEHLPLGEGELDWDGILHVLTEIEYGGVALVELSRHSHVAPLMAQRSLLFLRSVEARVRARSGGTARE